MFKKPFRVREEITESSGGAQDRPNRHDEGGRVRAVVGAVISRRTRSEEIARLPVETLQPDIDRRDIAPRLPASDARPGRVSIGVAVIRSTRVCHFDTGLKARRQSPRRLDPA
jgi:hypothetical protein